MKRGPFLLSTPLLTCANFSAASVAMRMDTIGANRYEITLEAESQASADALWRVLIDYDHHADYLPYLTQSRRLSHHDKESLVEQRGRFRILFWTYSVWVKQIVWERSEGQIQFQTVQGDFKQLDGEWRILPNVSGARLQCSFIIEPRRRVPGWAVKIAAKYYLAAMMEKLVERAEKSR